MKRAALSGLGRNAHVTMSGMAHLIQDLRAAGGLPPAASRTSMRRARNDIASIEAPFGALLQDVSCPAASGEVVFHTQAPMAMLSDTLKHSPSVAQYFVSALRERPCSPTTPWHILI